MGARETGGMGAWERGRPGAWEHEHEYEHEYEHEHGKTRATSGAATRRHTASLWATPQVTIGQTPEAL
jgi:hypothetical protein